MTAGGESRRRGPSPRMSAVLLGSAGLFAILSYAGVVPWKPAAYCRAIFCDPYHWQILAIGIGFVGAALGFLIPPRWRLLLRLNAIGSAVAFAAGILGSLAML